METTANVYLELLEIEQSRVLEKFKIAVDLYVELLKKARPKYEELLSIKREMDAIVPILKKAHRNYSISLRDVESFLAVQREKALSVESKGKDGDKDNATLIDKYKQDCSAFADMRQKAQDQEILFWDFDGAVVGDFIL